ncbi:MAG: 2,3-bisphosphoglycerate-independent phosphoglycerate mutase [Alphaproteobacteria bacterium]|nr:2,3-bisphosphoglycerate-independent phosphoglycerate mutase [Alphaproteobacteria bacterium]
MPTSSSPVVLLIMDGWGHREDPAHNAPRLAQTPVVDSLAAAAPQNFLLASGPAVGLPEGQVGNSEVGHMTIGAGRIIKQDLARIDDAVATRSLHSLPQFDDLVETLASSGGTAHLMALISPGGVHSRDAHILAMAEAMTARGVKVAVHAFTDGRDTLPKLAIETLPAFADALPEGARLATICGRYYAMDRDHRWERTEIAYKAMTFGQADHHADDASMALTTAYAAGLTDEFILPTVIGDYRGMTDGDMVVMGNFRADRARQILAPYGNLSSGVDTSSAPRMHPPLGLVPYSDELDAVMDCLFGQPDIPNTLGQVVAAAGKTQLRLAETEKYPHVTFFLNGGDEHTAKGEDRALIASPKVATYDLKPEMSAEGVCSRLVHSISTREHDLIIVNFANPDMVGHTGDLNAAITACETVDAAVGEAIAAIKAVGGAMIVTADHGNCDIMWDETAQSPHTAHTYNPVPVYLVGRDDCVLSDGGLSDLAPTLLELMGLDAPPEMTGQSLLRPKA